MKFEKESNTVEFQHNHIKLGGEFRMNLLSYQPIFFSKTF